MFSYYWGGDKTSNFVINMLCSPKNFKRAYSCQVVRQSVPNLCSAHNFVIWSRISKLFHRNDYHIEMTKFLACVQNLFGKHHPVRPALVFKLPTQSITFLSLKKSPWIHTIETQRKPDASRQNTGQVTLSTDQVYHGIGRKLGPDPLYKVFSNTGPSFKYFFFPSRDPGQFSMGS